MINKYIFQGMKRDVALVICGVTKHQYYYRSNNRKQGLSVSTSTFRQHNGVINKFDNQIVVEEIKHIHKDPDTVYGYHKMTSLLAILGYIINHKKVYRLMFEHQLLQEKHAKPSKTHVKYRKVFPTQPLEVLEMDIKFVWVEEFKRHAYVLSVIDTFTRVLLHGHVGYSIKKEHVKKVWEHVIVNHLQPHDCLHKQIHIEVR